MMNQMVTLAEKLAQADIPFEIVYMDEDIYSRAGESIPQIWYPNRDEAVCDVICHKYSYGGDRGLLEIMGLVSEECDDAVEGWLTAEKVFKRISAHYNTKK